MRKGGILVVKNPFSPPLVVGPVPPPAEMHLPVCRSFPAVGVNGERLLMLQLLVLAIMCLPVCRILPAVVVGVVDDVVGDGLLLLFQLLRLLLRLLLR